MERKGGGGGNLSCERKTGGRCALLSLTPLFFLGLWLRFMEISILDLLTPDPCICDKINYIYLE